MKKSLLMTTALVALVSASNARAEDWTVSAPESIENQILNKDNVTIQAGGEIAISGDTESGIIAKSFTMEGGKLTATSVNGSADTGIFVKSDSSDINLNGGTIELTNSRIYKGNDTETSGDINISGGDITLNKDAYIEMRKENSGNVNITGGNLLLNENSALLINSNNDQEVEGNASKVIINGEGAQITATGNNRITGNIDFTNGTLTVSDNASLTSGDITMSGEDAQIDLSGQLNTNISGNGNITFQNSASNISGNVSGSHLTFEADHSLSQAISGGISNLASLNVNKGTLTFDKQPTSITNLNVAGGLDIGTNTVKATNVSFKDNSTLKFTVAGKEDGSYGKIQASKIDISTTGTKLDLTLNSSVLGKDESKEFTILDGKVTGDFAELSQNSRYEFEKLGNGQYKITGKASAADIAVEAGGNANNAGTASAWDGVSLDNPSGSTSGQVANALAELAGKPDAASQKAYVDALTAVAPEVAPMVQHTQTETANQVFGAIGTRLSGGSISTGGEGMSSGDNIFERAAMWVQGLFNKSKLDDTSKSYGFDADSNGIAMGAEKYVTEDTKVGLGYAYTNTDIDGFKRDTDVDTHTAFVYGEYKPSNWYVNGIASYGWSDYDESKNVAGINVKSDYDAETFGLQAMTGYDMQVKGVGLTPEIGLRYVHISQDSYKDSADQRVSANDSDILTGVIGAKVSKTWTLENGMNIKPEARIAATYDLMNDDTNSVVTLANGSAYSVEGEALDRFGMEFGAGLTAEINDNVELSLGYEGKFREDYQDHTGLLNAKYKF